MELVFILKIDKEVSGLVSKKMLSKVLTCFSVASVGFYELITPSSALNMDSVVKILGGADKAIEQIENYFGINYDQLLNNINNDGTINEKMIDANQRQNIFNKLSKQGFSYNRDANGVYTVTRLSDGNTWNLGQLKRILKQLRDTVSSQTQSGGSVRESGEDGTVGINSMTSKIQSMIDVKGFLVGTQLPILQNYKLEESLRNANIDFWTMIEAIKDIHKESAITLDIGQAKWVIENRGLDLNKSKDFYFNSNIEISQCREAKIEIPQEVRQKMDGKESVAINFKEKDNKNLPFHGKVIINLDKKLAKKKMDVYYIVEGKSYEAGQVVITDNGQVMLSFDLIGDFILIEAG